jgi:hypothetical protein
MDLKRMDLITSKPRLDPVTACGFKTLPAGDVADIRDAEIARLEFVALVREPQHIQLAGAEAGQLFYRGQHLRDQRLRISVEPELLKKNQKVRHLRCAYPGPTCDAARFAAWPREKCALRDLCQR